MIKLAKPISFCDENDDGEVFDFGEGYDVEDVLAERKEWGALVEKEKRRADELQAKLDCNLGTSEGCQICPVAEKAEAKLKEISELIYKLDIKHEKNTLSEVELSNAYKATVYSIRKLVRYGE